MVNEVTQPRAIPNVSTARSETQPVVKATAFTLPEIWNDDDIMYDLMQPIKRPQRMDPYTYDRKVHFWGDLIRRYAKEQRVLVVSIRVLQSLFSRYFPEENIRLSPGCLHEVMEHLQQSNEAEVMKDQSSFVLTLVKTGFNYLVKAPLSAAIKLVFSDTLNSDAPAARNVDELFVFIKLSEELIAEFIKNFNDAKVRHRLTLRLPAYELHEFESFLCDCFPHEATRNFVRKSCIEKYCCVKLMDDSNSSLSQIIWVSENFQTKVAPVTKSEVQIVAGLARIKNAIKHQEAEEKVITTDIDDRRIRIKSLLAQGKLKEAKDMLKRTKLLEQTVERKRAQLQNLESMKLQIDSAADNQIVLHVLADSSQTLKKAVGGELGLLEAENTMSELSESVQETNEISELIASLGRNILDEADEDELVAELRCLMNPINKPSSHDITSDELERELAELNVDDVTLPEPPGIISSKSKPLTG